MKKTLIFILVCLMLVSSLAACSSPDVDQSSDTTTAAPVQTEDDGTTAPTTDADGYLLNSLPDDLNFDGETIHILTWDTQQPEFTVESLTGEVVNDAIYSRNEMVQSQLNVELAFTEEPGSVNHQTNFVNFVQRTVSAGEQVYDIIATYSRTSGTLALEGYLYDLNSVQYLDFEKPWWPKTMLETQSIGDNLYFVSGDASTNLIYMIYGIYYNKDMLEDLLLADPQQLVLDHKWTLDKLLKMSTGVYSDLDGSGSRSINDRYGLSAVHYHLDAFYNGSELRLVESSADDLLVISPDFSSEKAINLADKLTPWVNSDDVYIGNAYETLQKNGQTLFMLNRLQLASNYLRHGDFEYGVLPIPLYDEKQENYASVLANPYTNYCIISDCDDPDRAGAVLEAWASAAYRTTTPALFETTMKVKYSEDSINAQMYDIIRETITFDLGRIFGGNLDTLSDYYNLAIVDGVSWASKMASYLGTLDAKMETIVKKFSELD